MRRGARLIPATLGAALCLALAACGGTPAAENPVSPSATAAVPPPQLPATTPRPDAEYPPVPAPRELLQQATTAARAATSAEIRTTLGRGDQAVVQLVRGDVAGTHTYARVDTGAETVEALTVDGQMWVKNPGDKQWTPATPEQLAAQPRHMDVPQMLDFDMFGDPATVTAEKSSVGDVAAWRLSSPQSGGASLWVAAAAPHLPLMVANLDPSGRSTPDPDDETSFGAVTHFSQWNAVPPIQPPPADEVGPAQPDDPAVLPTDGPS